jgi:hypothetical protein
MQRYTVQQVAAIALLFGLPLISAPVQGQATPTPADVKNAGWLAGCWELKTANRVTHEQWMAPLGGMMLGMSRTVTRDTAREYEYLRIESRDGIVAYVAQPSGQELTRFPATVLTDSLLVFSNPGHDFPQRIVYRRTSAASITARIEGTRDGRERGIDFPMQKVACGIS